MKLKKTIIGILLGLGIIALILIVIYHIYGYQVYKMVRDTGVVNIYDTEPISRCVYGAPGLFRIFGECDKGFQKKCIKNNGQFVKQYTGRGTNGICLPVATDTQKACSSNEECMYGCGFEQAINNNCILVESTQGIDRGGGKDYENYEYVAYKYECQNKDKPANCLPGPNVIEQQGVMVLDNDDNSWYEIPTSDGRWIINHEYKVENGFLYFTDYSPEE